MTVSSITVEDGKLAILVKNTGRLDVATGTAGSTYIYINDLSKPSNAYRWESLSDLSFLKSNGESIINPKTLSDGDYEIMACVDATFVVTERNEDNNCLTESITVETSTSTDTAETEEDDLLHQKDRTYGKRDCISSICGNYAHFICRI